MRDVLVWNGAGLRPAEAGTDLLVADSWLVDGGAVAGLGHHRDRFVTACRALGVSAEAFFDAVPDHLPAEGRWFPRVELGAGPELRLRVRPAPPTSADVVLAPHPGSDPRVAPRTKGPDLMMLGDVRARAAELGAGEAVLCAADGTLLEGAYSAVVWWRGDALCVPADDLPVLDSVTRRRLLDEAARRGVEVRRERVTPGDLDGLETWSLSALHGIRAVTAWVGCAVTAGPVERAGTWRRHLAAELVPV
jgi:branched-subunit amino acid aminotransferase/4-amino-4-deoxychorismate lyase